MRRWARAVLLAVVVTSLVAVPSRGQDAVALRVSFTAGETLTYDFTTSLDQRMTIDPGPRQSLALQARGREVHQVREVGTDGSAVIHITYEDITTTINGTTNRQPWTPDTLRVGADGVVTERAPGRPDLTDYPIPLPPQAVSVGTSWSRPVEVDMGTMAIRGTQTMTLVAVEQTAEGAVARLRLRIEARIVDPGRALRDLGLQVLSADGGLTAEGEALWSVDRSRLLFLSRRDTFTFDARVNVEGTLARLSHRIEFAGTWTLQLPGQAAPDASAPQAPAAAPDAVEAAPESWPEDDAGGP